MYKYFIIKFIIQFISAISFAQTVSYQTFEPGATWKDNNGVHINAHGGGILYLWGVYYWYGEHKVAGKLGNQAQVGVHCYSSKDLYNWIDEGIVLHVDTTPGSILEKGCIIERPKVIYNKMTKKFVMWFHYEKKGNGYNSSLSGVAISDNPIGPFTFTKVFRPNAGTWPLNVLPMHKTLGFNTVNAEYHGGMCSKDIDSVNFVGRDFNEGQMARDMNLFVDDDGKAYHIYSSESNGTLHISQLTDDYLSCSGKWIRIFPGRFNEGAAMFKRKGYYYLFMSGCTSWNPNPGRSAMAKSIWGPWKELGNPCVDADSATTYHSQSTFVLPVKGKNDAYIYMGDRWTPKNPIDGRYVWLPIHFEKKRPILNWYEKWNLNCFKY